MKTLVLFAVLALGGAAFAQEKPCCAVKPEPKVAAAAQEKSCCAVKPQPKAAAKQEKACCAVKPQPKAAAAHGCTDCQAAQPCSHCDSLTAKNPDARERAFWAEAANMQANDKVAHGELGACCATNMKGAKDEACCADKAKMGVGVKAPACSHGENGHADHGMGHAHNHGKAKAAKRAKFKVYAGGQYHLYCCAHMAEEARAGFRSQGMTVGNVQKVVGKHMI